MTSFTQEPKSVSWYPSEQARQAYEAESQLLQLGSQAYAIAIMTVRMNVVLNCFMVGYLLNNKYWMLSINLLLLDLLILLLTSLLIPTMTMTLFSFFFCCWVCFCWWLYFYYFSFCCLFSCRWLFLLKSLVNLWVRSLFSFFFIF